MVYSEMWIKLLISLFFWTALLVSGCYVIMVSRKKEMPPDITRYERIAISRSRLRKLVRDHRSAKGMTLREVANRADVSPTTLNKLERGDHHVQLDSFLKVLSVLDILPEHVFEIDGEATALPPTSIEKKIARWSTTQDAPKLLENLAKLLRELPEE